MICVRSLLLKFTHKCMTLCCCEQGHLLCCRVAEPALPATTAAASASLRCATADSSRSTGTGAHVSAAECDSATSTCQPAAASTAGMQRYQEPESPTAAVTSARRKLDTGCIDLGACNLGGSPCYEKAPHMALAGVILTQVLRRAPSMTLCRSPEARATFGGF